MNIVTGAMGGSPSPRAWAGLMFVYVVLGSPYLAIRLVIDEASPLASMSMRFALSAALMGLVVLVARGPRALRVPVRQIVGAAVLGALLLGIGNGFNALGQSHGVSTSVTALLVACVPMIVVGLQALTGIRPTIGALGGIVLGLGGLGIVVAGDGQSHVPLVGAAIVLTGATGWAVGSWGKPYLAMPADNLVGAAYQLGGAALLLLVMATVTREQVDLRMGPVAWGAMAYMVLIVSMLGFTVYVWLLDHMDVSLVTTHTYVNPIVAVALGVAILSEPLSWSVVLGGGLVIVAVMIIIVAASRKPAAARHDQGRTDSPPDEGEPRDH